MYSIIIDEAFSEKVFTLGGLVIDDEVENNLTNEVMKLKQSWGLEERLPIKWSLGDNKEDERSVKQVLMDRLGSGWLISLRNAALDIISRYELLCIVSIHEERRFVDVLTEDIKTRIGRTSGVSSADFYEWGFKFVLQRFCRVYRSESDVKRVVLDMPPKTKQRASPESIFKVYQKAYYEGMYMPYPWSEKIDPLRDLNFEPTLYLTMGRYSPVSQLADFVCGAVYNWAQTLLDSKPNRMLQSRQHLAVILPKFHGFRSSSLLINGLMTWPAGGRLEENIKTDLPNVLALCASDKNEGAA